MLLQLIGCLGRTALHILVLDSGFEKEITWPCRAWLLTGSGSFGMAVRYSARADREGAGVSV